MSDRDESLRTRVTDWLERSGLPLEMRTARAFHEAGFEVSQGESYVDPDQGTSREIDVVARDHDTIGLLHILFCIECKSSEKPWLVLKQNNTVMNRSLAFGVRSSNTKDAFDLLYTDQETHRFACTSDHAGYGFREIFSDKGDRAYGAAMSAANACQGLLESTRYALPRYAFAFPLVVVDTPLFEAHLNAKGRLEISEVNVSQFVLTSAGERGALVRVLTLSTLADRAKAFSVLSKSMLKVLSPLVEKWRLERLGRNGTTSD